MNRTADFRKSVIDPAALAHPPLAPSDKVPFLRALAHVGRAVYSEEWADAVTLAARPLASADVVKRVGAAFKALRQSIIDRRVTAYWRLDRSGAGFALLPVEHLLNEDANLRMRGYIWNSKLRCAQHVFVDADALGAAFPLAPEVEAPAGIDPADLSKYLQLALHVHSLGFGPDFDGQKKEIKRVLVREASKFDLTLSAQQEEYLATFLRNEEAQAGKNRAIKAKRV